MAGLELKILYKSSLLCVRARVYNNENYEKVLTFSKSLVIMLIVAMLLTPNLDDCSTFNRIVQDSQT